METTNSKTLITDGASGHGAGYSYLDCMILSRMGELEKSIGESGCGVKETIHSQSLMHSKEFCDTNKNVADVAVRNLVATKDGVCILDKSILESRQILAEKIDRESDSIRTQLNQFERQVSENFCQVRTEAKDNTQKVLDKMAYYEDRRKDDIIDELRHERRYNDIRFMVQGVSNEVNGIKQLFNSQQFEQRFSSKVNQFGAGNVALPVQTANQG